MCKRCRLIKKDLFLSDSGRGRSAEVDVVSRRTSQHVECVKFLLEKGADPCSETDTGDNCLHMAAKNGYVECMNVILQAQVTIGAAEPSRLGDVLLPYSPPVKFVDVRNSKLCCRFFLQNTV